MNELPNGKKTPQGTQTQESKQKIISSTEKNLVTIDPATALVVVLAVLLVPLLLVGFFSQ